ncbi:tetratricopeptide repeat protein [Paraflavisolibacter sp. H34]|uniref:tetratricopeptide repeat protein n=1 Tax=Huijunlia imazamoxiresistens TaxID=3127457 RepID=UPI0030197EEC
MKAISLTCLLTLAACSGYAQSPAPFNSGDVIGEAVKLHDQQQYKKAIELFRTVPRNDTNYVLAQYELSLSYTSDSNYTAALQACEEALGQPGREYELELLVAKGSNLDDLGKTEEALRVFDSALTRYPDATNLLFNKAMTLVRLKKTPEAEKMFRDILLRDPYHTSAHMRLATCALQTGRVVPAMMALFATLFINPDGPHVQGAIQLLDGISKHTDAIRAVVEKRPAPDPVFARAEQIILSKAALDKNYKLQASLDDPIFRQLQALMEVLTFSEGEPDFFMQFYVPLYKEVFSRKLFEPAVFQAFASVPLDAITAYRKKNGRETKEVVAAVVAYLNALRSTRQLSFADRQTAPALYHFSEDKLVGKGTLDAKGNTTGPWVFFYPNGNKKAVGTFTASGKKTGDWTYYFPSGQLQGTDKWENGLETGEDILYSEEGIVTNRMYWKAGKRQGEKRTFFAIGTPRKVENYVEDLLEGPGTEFYSTGEKSEEATYKAGKLHGTLTAFYQNGRTQKVATYANGLLDGPYKTFHANGRPELEATYTGGKLSGEVRDYHPNGQLKELRTFTDDLQEGADKSYNDEGVLASETFFQKGKAEGLGKYYDSDGKLYGTFLYEKNLLKTATYLNKEGQPISTSERRNKLIDLDMYTPEGYKVSHHRFNDAAKEVAPSTYFYPSGKVKETNDYKDGRLEGYSKGYYENGARQYEIAYRNGEKDGPTTHYHLNGQVRQKGWYTAGTTSGDWEEYSEKGHLSERYTLLNGNLHGAYQYFHANGKLNYEDVYQNGWLRAVNTYDSTGKKISTATIRQGAGAYTAPYPNGQKRFEGTFRNGEFHGPYTSYYFDGTVRVKKNFRYGHLHGAYAEYQYGGQPEVTGTYESGERTGTWKYYQKDGKVWKEETWVDGALHGKVLTYEDGVLRREYHYKNGELHGTYTRFGGPGQVAYFFYYREGKLTGYSYPDKNGQPVPVKPLPGGSGKVRTFYASGTLSAEMEYADGKLNGPSAAYYPNGQVAYRETYEYGYGTGKTTWHHPNGALEAEFAQFLDNYDGPYRSYHENGKLHTEGHYYNGVENGTFRYYDATGKLTEQRYYYYGTLLNSTK